MEKERIERPERQSSDVIKEGNSPSQIPHGPALLYCRSGQDWLIELEAHRAHGVLSLFKCDSEG